jgi:hypothetical protein
MSGVVSNITLAIVLLFIPAVAVADGTDVAPANTVFTVSGLNELQGGRGPEGTVSAAADIPGAVHEEVGCYQGGAQTCSEPALCDDGTIMTFTWFQTPDGDRLNYQSSCPQDAVAAGPPVVTPGLVLAAFRRVPLPASELGVQPPGGRTLVNFETNFFTDDGGFTRVVRLLGQRVVLRIWPASFGWRFGDGEGRETVSAGSPYPDLEVTHRYLDRGRVAARVDTTYAAEFSVNGGPWREVGGTVTVPGDPEGLRVVTARPVLVGD